ncbi:hypothetical protein B7494_g1084 [Chlorociboria aeruginascens]|nr:hypothetical protein B7494_g1084 [Chlorociboria aeruginascens]
MGIPYNHYCRCNHPNHTDSLLAKNIHWDVLVILPNTDPLPLQLQVQIKEQWTVKVGVPSRLIQDFSVKNRILLYPKLSDIPSLTGSLDKPRIACSAQALELSPELNRWIQDFSQREGRGAVSMLNLLAFKDGMKEEYLKYGAAFTKSVGSRRGGNAKIVGTVIKDNEGEQNEWDEMALAHYPSILHFADMLASEDYQEVNHKYRVGSLKDTFILCTTELELPGAATLTRVRDNQRRCRARKREYVAELQKKIQDMQTAAVRTSTQQPHDVVKRLETENLRLQQYVYQLERERLDQQAAATLAEVESQNTIERLQDENEELRELLARADPGDVRVFEGLEKSGGDLELGDYGNAADGHPPLVQNELVAIPEPLISSTSTSFEDILSIPFLNPLDLSNIIDFNHDNLGGDTSVTARTVDGASDCCPSKLTSDCRPEWPSIVDSLTPCQSWPSRISGSKSERDTTLCSVAYELVRQHNHRGLDMIDIGIRLWDGFRKGSKDDEGCKVENKLLFSVLEYISG